MLPLVLLLMSDPATTTPPVSRFNPEAAAAIEAALAAHSARASCTPGLHQVERGPARNDGSAGNGLNSNLLYSADGEVRVYYLLERNIGGCSVPISYSVPGNQGGEIRNLGRPDGYAPIR